MPRTGKAKRKPIRKSIEGSLSVTKVAWASMICGDLIDFCQQTEHDYRLPPEVWREEFKLWLKQRGPRV